MGCSVRISDFIDTTNRAQSSDEIFSAYENALAEIGLDRIMYSALNNHPIYDSVNSPSVMRNYPDDWITHYVENGYIQSDPVRKQAIRARAPFIWREMMAKSKLTRAEKNVMVEGEAAGLHDGCAVPLHGPYGEVMGVGLASSLGGVDIERHLGVVHALTVQFHTAYSSLAMPELSSGHPVHLTPREREVLQWCALGKSNWAIGEILNISEHGVEFHVRNILSKLSADSRITAVVKALHLGLISA